MELPETRLEKVPVPVILTPFRPFPAMTFPCPSPVPPTVLLPPPEIQMPSLLFGKFSRLSGSRPMTFPWIFVSVALLVERTMPEAPAGIFPLADMTFLSAGGAPPMRCPCVVLSVAATPEVVIRIPSFPLPMSAKTVGFAAGGPNPMKFPKIRTH